MKAPGAAAVLLAVGRAAADAGLPVHLVGGAVRDVLLSRATRDLDVAVEADALAVFTLARGLGSRAGWRIEAEHARFGTATLRAPGGLRVDLAATRRESYPRPAALPVVSEGAGIDEDLGRRDVTVHAMGRRVRRDGSLGGLRDPFGGRRDLEARTLRLLHDRSLVDDPTRAFRVVRYATRLGFRIDPRFGEQLRAAREAGAFAALSGDRMRRALEEVLGEGGFDESVSLLLAYGLFDDVLPGWGEALRRKTASKGAEREGGRQGEADENVAARWGRLLSPLSPAEKKGVAERLAFSRALRRSAGVPAR
jgi:tRNA nucleotidyltransferase (CCA-adding enzyme)